VVAGVAGGLGVYFGVDSTVVRLLFILVTLFGGSGILIYLIMWVMVPSDGEEASVEKTVRKNVEEIKMAAEKLVRSVKE